MLKKEKALEKSNFTKSEIISLVTLSLIIGLTMGILFNKTNVITKNTIVSDENLQELIENYEYIINNYYEEVDKRNLINSAIEGMMGSLEDPHSMYFDENESENFSITLDGEYKGMGIQIAKDLKSGNKMILVEPRAYSESQQIADYLKNRNSVVVNLKRVTSDQAKRIIDFLTGTIYAIGGDLQKLGNGIYLCTPNNVSVQGKMSENEEKGKTNKTKFEEEIEF